MTVPEVYVGRVVVFIVSVGLGQYLYQLPDPIIDEENIYQMGPVLVH